MTPFAKKVLQWYHSSGRKDLPWQKNKTAYRVWLSEIMLQQTQVSTVIPYFERFLARFPTVEALASSSQDEVLHLWTGLGYYTRARNLYKAAKLVVSEYRGQFPDNIDEVKALPGIGRSTAAAILSFVFNQSHAVLDGNVRRTLSRCFAVEGWPGKKAVEDQLWRLAEANTPEKHAAQYNQAMMDIGAMVCTRVNPKCERCPLHEQCVSSKQGRPLDYPNKRPSKTKPERFTQYCIFFVDQSVLLEKRPSKGVWGGLYCFPEMPKNQHEGIHLLLRRYSLPPSIVMSKEVLRGFRHTFSHYHLNIAHILIKLSHIPEMGLEEGIWLWYNSTRPIHIGLASPVSKLLSNKRFNKEVSNEPHRILLPSQ